MALTNDTFWRLAASAYALIMSMLELTWSSQLLFSSGQHMGRKPWYEWNFFKKLDDSKEIVRFLWIFAVLQMMWLISTLFFAAYHKRKWIAHIWMTTTGLVSLWSIVTSIYFLTKIYETSSSPEIKTQSRLSSYLALLIIFSGGFMFWTVNVGILVFLWKTCVKSCILCPQTNDHKGYYNQLKNNYIFKNNNENDAEIQMEDVVFDAQDFRLKGIFHINDEKMRTGKY